LARAEKNREKAHLPQPGQAGAAENARQQQQNVRHIQNIYRTSEMATKPTCSILEQVASENKRRGNFFQ
jgi:hypothetical protein